MPLFGRKSDDGYEVTTPPKEEVAVAKGRKVAVPVSQVVVPLPGGGGVGGGDLVVQMVAPATKRRKSSWLVWPLQKLQVGLAFATVAVAAPFAGMLLLVSLGYQVVPLPDDRGQPLANSGDALVVKPTDPKWLTEGDVIVFNEPGNPAVEVVRQIVAVNSNGSFTTQRALAAVADPWVFTPTAPVLKLQSIDILSFMGDSRKINGGGIIYYAETNTQGERLPWGQGYWALGLLALLDLLVWRVVEKLKAD